MKKNLFSLLSILFMAAVCTGFASCGGDDDDGSKNAAYDKMILGEWVINVNPQEYMGRSSRVIFFADGKYEAKDYYNFNVTDERDVPFTELNGKISGTWAISRNRITIDGYSQIAGDYIIDGLVENGMRLIRADSPNEYPYLIGGWHNR